MKRNHIYGLIVTAAMAMAAPACSDDLGNYTYTPVNEVDVAYGDELVRGETYTYMAHLRLYALLSEIRVFARHHRRCVL